jgi:hypothetical protein
MSNDTQKDIDWLRQLYRSMEDRFMDGMIAAAARSPEENRDMAQYPLPPGQAQPPLMSNQPPIKPIPPAGNQR